jgi:2-polyprenyl-6-methoxyphenol hydroxylase-like FAD-dependent oxidoreductase
MFGLMPTARVGGKLRLSMFWSLPRSEYAAWLTQSLEDWKTELLDLCPGSAPVVSQIFDHDQFSLATYRHARPKRLSSGPVCVIGDAAHSMSPQLGLGTTLALQDVIALAYAVEEHGEIAGAELYSTQRLGAVRGYQLLSRALTPCFQAHGLGLWRDALFAAGCKIPVVRNIMYRAVAPPALSVARPNELEVRR